MGQIIVRWASRDDVPWLLDELRAFDRFFGAKRALFPDEGYARERLGEMLDRLDVFPFYVAIRETVRLGFIAGVCQPHFFNPGVRVLSELFWWVAPEHRATTTGARLLNAYLDWGRAYADWIVFTLETQSPVNPASLERRGFRLHERSYLLEV